MKILTGFCKTVETGMDPRLPGDSDFEQHYTYTVFEGILISLNIIFFIFLLCAPEGRTVSYVRVTNCKGPHTIIVISNRDPLVSLRPGTRDVASRVSGRM